MGPDAIIVSVIIVLAVILFVTEKLSVDLVAILVMSLLVISGVISPQEGVAGFSNPATITVAGMFVISAALFRTGAINLMGRPLTKVFRKNFKLGLLLMMIFVGITSAFINNTPVVAVLIPIIAKAAKDAKVSVSKLLMPMSFASIFGGTCTLIGTSTNIMVSGIAEQNGLDPFGMFQLTPVGIVIFVVGITYMMFIGHKLLPSRDATEVMSERFSIRDYLADIVIMPDSPNVNKKLQDAPLLNDLDLEVIEVYRDGDRFIVPPIDFVLQANDQLRVRCDLDKIKRIKDREKIKIAPSMDQPFDLDHDRPDTTILELIITANSEFDGKTLAEVEFKRKYRAVPLAIQHRNEILHEDLNDIRLKSGDILLAEVKTHRMEKFKRLQSKQEAPFVIISEEGITEFKRNNFWLVIGTIAAVVSLAATGILNIMIGAIAGSAFLITTGCISTRDTYNSIDWKVIFLLAGALSIGKAMENSGLAQIVADGLVAGLGDWGLVALLAGFYLVTNIFTEIMSNNATAALMAPIAIVTAQSLGVDPLPFLLAVTFAASASFLTPVGYQTNTMIYGAGQYRFIDFTKTGILLSFTLWILVTLSISYFFSF